MPPSRSRADRAAAPRTGDGPSRRRARAPEAETESPEPEPEPGTEPGTAEPGAGPPAPVTSELARRLRRALLDWYARSARDLPWRRTREAYPVWVSEVMLQQTRVETVRERWGEFLARFPDPATLGAADEASLLEAWSGLGYYRRVRSLARAAQVVAEEHGGEFPMELEAALALPGVGRYTAGAVLSIAGDRRVPLVDGNVARVLSRLFELDAPLQSRASEKALWSLAEALLPRRPRAGSAPGSAPSRGAGARGPGAWNQALMELGATLCVPRTPRCAECPVERLCRARASGREAELPRPAPKRATVDVALEVLWVLEGTGAGARVLLEERAPGGRMAGLLECPTREVGLGADGAGLLTGLWPAEWAAPGPGLALCAGSELGEWKHAITHHRIRARVKQGVVEGAGSVRAPFVRVPVSELPGQRLTGMARKIARALGS